ncbi:acriflavin resistance protein [Shewanella sediminis HAW-EB3]|uniref:Acriflavin resistance protein n=1 Tax=Shewanella sediminis (strain HAW-EB3) TaxID=425104 RepID=A8FUR1_SHESH|nr:efflux RND transporter permease subunit [Shewanella sediminis]ABV36584.1 acriflavin resistance protein [Shewanella sediminis HAW-EB3]
MAHKSQLAAQQPGNNPLEGVITWFAQNPVAANLLLISILALGLFSLTSLRKEAFPSIEPNKVTVSVNYDSGDAKQAEEGIAIKIEDALETVSGIKRITSKSNAYGSTVTIEKKTGYPLDDLLNDVKTNVDAIYNFPLAAENPVIDKARKKDHALWVQFYGDAGRTTFQQLAEKLKNELLAQSEITDLEIKAKVNPMISVEVDEIKLQAYGLTLSDVTDAINAESLTPVSTSLRNKNKTVRLKASAQAYRQLEFSQLPLITTTDGTLITLGDVALVQDTFEDVTYSLSRYNQQPGMAIEIVMGEQGDLIKAVEQASDVVKKWQTNGALPEGVFLETWSDESILIKDRLALLADNALSGVALVFIVLALFLNIRVAFWVAAGIPFVFFGTLYFMTDSFMALSINELTTFGFIMALGIVVDDAVVVGESIYTTRREAEDSLGSTVKGTMKVAIPTLFGVLTTVAAFACLSNVAGDLGQIFSQFAAVVTICLLLSMVESKLILPCHLAHVNTHKSPPKGILGSWSRIQHGADAGLEWFNKKVYRNMIEWALKLRYAIIFGFITVFILVIGMPMNGTVRTSFFPEIAGGTVTSNLVMQNDASFGQTDANLRTIEAAAIHADLLLRENKGVEETQIGSLQLIADADSTGKITVELIDSPAYSAVEFKNEWTRMSGELEGVKKVNFLAYKHMVDNFKVELKAGDYATVKQAGDQLLARLKAMPAVSGIDHNLSPGQPQFRFTVTEQGRALGMNSASLSKQVLESFGGDIVQRYQRNTDEVKVRVRYPERKRQTLADIMQARVRTPAGTLVPLSVVANITSEYQQDEITRINSLRAVYITAALDKNQISPSELVAQLEATLVPELEKQFSDLNIYFAGEAEQKADTMASMAEMFMLALLIIYVLLAVPLKSYTQPILIMLAIPFGIVGAILGHWWNDLTISILSLFGILALSGVVVNDSLLLVSRFNELIKQKSLSLHDAIVEACTSRLRAVFLTSLTTFVGLSPILAETSLQAQFLIPAAASLGYGIVFATVITLVLIPALLFIQVEVGVLLSTLKVNLFKTRKLVTKC